MPRLYVGNWYNILKAYGSSVGRGMVPSVGIMETPQQLEEGFVRHAKWVCTHPTLFDKKGEYITGDLIQLMSYSGFLMKPAELKVYVSRMYAQLKAVGHKEKVSVDILTNTGQCHFRFKKMAP